MLPEDVVARIPDADVADRVGVAGQVDGVRVGLQLERGDLDVAQAHRRGGGLDVPGDVRLLLLGLVRLHLHALHELRVDRAGDHRDQRPQADAEDRQRPARGARC